MQSLTKITKPPMLFLIFLTLLLTTTAINSTQKVTAQLSILSFQPLKFNLTFSQSIPLPKFQLLFNEISIDYTVQNPTVLASYYIISANFQDLVTLNDYKTQKYVLMFTQPLVIADGRLSLNSFILRATLTTNLQYNQANNLTRKTFYKYQTQSTMSRILSIAIVATIYFLAYTTVIGIHAYNFLSIYIYICLQTAFFTSLQYNCAYLLLFQPSKIPNQYRRFLYFIAPHTLIAISFVVSLITRRLFRKLANGTTFCKQIYFYFSYRIFIITWQIMCIPIFANVTYLIQGIIKFSVIDPRIIYAYIYFSIAVIVFYSYMAYFTVNPQINQSPQKWQQYIHSDHFQMFTGFHLGIDPRDWKKRNFTFIVSIFRIVIVTFVTCTLVNTPNLLLQNMYVIYLFTLRPFKYDFFNYCIIGIQIFVIVFYLYRYLVELYAEMSPLILTSVDIANILLTNIIYLCIITFTYFILGIYQFYQRVNVFRVSIYDWAVEQKKRKQFQKIGAENIKSYRFSISDRIHRDNVQQKLMAQQKQMKMIQKQDEHHHEQSSQSRRKKKKNQQSSSPSRSHSPKSKSKSQHRHRKIKKLQSNQSKQDSKQLSSSQSPIKSSTTKKLKEKSSLLQSIGFGHQSP